MLHQGIGIIKTAPKPEEDIGRFMPVREFLAARLRSGRPRYCSRGHLYKLKKLGKVKFVYSLGKPYIDMQSWENHFD